jgi:hypothetical protein
VVIDHSAICAAILLEHAGARVLHVVHGPLGEPFTSLYAEAAR